MDNLDLRRCVLCGAQAVLWSENKHDHSISADYPCRCNTEHRTAYANAYACAYYLRQHYLAFMAQLEAKDKRLFHQVPTLTADNAQAYLKASDFKAPSFLYLYGAAGIGKTHLAIFAARSALANGQTVRYVSESELLDERRSAWLAGHETTLPEVLLLDDIAKKGRASDFYASQMHDLLEICDRRDIGVLITSNHAPYEAARRIALDEANASAIESRFKLGSVIELTGQSRREGSKQ